MITLPEVNFDTLLLSPIGHGLDINQGDDAGGGYPINKHLYSLDDNSCVLILDTKIRTFPFLAFYVYVYDGDGSYTWYSSGVTYPDGYGYLQQPICIAPGLFSVTTSNNNGGPDRTYVFKVANLKLNNSSPISLFPGPISFSNPCYNTAPKVYYDPQRRIVACGFYNPSGGFGGPVYSSNYKVNTDGSFALLTQGYVGHFDTSGYDPWDNTSSNPGGAPYKSGDLGKGLPISCGIPGTGYWLGFNSYNVNPGVSTNCITPSGARVTSGASAVLYSTLTNAEPYFVDSNIPGIYGLSSWAYKQIQFLMLGLSFVAPYVCTVPGVVVCQTVVVTGKYLFSNVNIAGYYNGLVKASLPTGWNLYSPSAVSRAKFGLSNFSRPVSVVGKYKA